ncbi:MAG: hypothetical protein IPM48_11835 [Saprospiraceae bacterium]|nr:hypothetical protein [Saprospiraceae bacterium]
MCKLKIVNYIVFIYVFFCIENLNAQLGLGVQLELQSNEINGFNSNDIGNRISLHYKFRLKNARIEFLPGLSIGWGSSGIFVDTEKAIYYNEFSPQIQLPILIYPFDFRSDCNCPTFKKSGNAASKGLHLMLSTAYRFVMRDYELQSKRHQVFPLGAGFGMDFGMSPVFTLTPFMMFQYVFSDQLLVERETTSLGRKEFVFGLRGQFHKPERRRGRSR